MHCDPFPRTAQKEKRQAVEQLELRSKWTYERTARRPYPTNASSLAIRYASILAIKDLSPKLEVSKILRELLQVLTVIFGNVSLSIVSEGV